MKIKKLLLTLFTLSTLTVSQNLFASHIIGAMITYQYVATNQYQLTFKYYRDCDGIAASPSGILCYSSASLSLNGTVSLMPVPGTGLEIFPLSCFINNVSSCQGGVGLGIQEWVYTGLVTLPQQAADWIFSFEECCRNVGILSLNNAGATGVYVYAKLDNLNFAVNSSPQCSLPFALYCVNVLSTYSLSYSEPDGDSLVFSMVPAEDATNGCPYSPFTLTYFSPYSATQPVTTSLPTVFDAVTGSFTFAPSFAPEVSVIDLLIKEYRNGMLVGETKSDNMIYIAANGIPDPNWMKGKIFSDQNNNGIYDAGEQGIAGTIVEVQPAMYLGASNINGDYSIALTTGSFTAAIPNPPLYSTSIAPSTNSATFTGTFQTDSINNFAVGFIPNVQDLRVTLTGSNPSSSINTSMYVTYQNIGTTSVVSGSATLIYDTSFVYVNSSVIPTAISGDTITWNFSNLLPQSFNNIQVVFSLPVSVPLNTPLISFAEILPIAGDSVPQDNLDVLNQIALGPLDPNTKTVIPDGPITTTQGSAGTYLEYTIYFQNTGTAPAINVFIDDTLDQNFNIPTFEVLSASHNYTWNISRHGIVKITFNNIVLPDSGTNQLLSHGFIKYRIKPKNNLIVGDKMTNTAYIVFDNNAPLATNSTSTTVINPVSISQLSPSISNLVIYPNPVNNFLNIEMNLKEAEQLKIKLYNLTGEEIWKTKNIVARGLFKKQININDLSKGIYFLKITTAKGMSVSKIVKN